MFIDPSLHANHLAGTTAAAFLGSCVNWGKLIHSFTQVMNYVTQINCMAYLNYSKLFSIVAFQRDSKSRDDRSVLEPPHPINYNIAASFIRQNK